jgi:hypothetical protein
MAPTAESEAVKPDRGAVTAAAAITTVTTVTVHVQTPDTTPPGAGSRGASVITKILGRHSVHFFTSRKRPVLVGLEGFVGVMLAGLGRRVKGEAAGGVDVAGRGGGSAWYRGL